jgi:hypothetical protein
VGAVGSRAAKCFRRVVCGLLVAVPALGVAGCAADDPPAPSPVASAATTSVAVPAGGVSLAQLGFRHGPAGLVTVPAGVRLTQQVDQPNVVTAGFAAPGGEEIATWLQARLPGADFTISASGPDAVLFRGHGWSGAFTVGNGESALTLRRER